MAVGIAYISMYVASRRPSPNAMTRVTEIRRAAFLAIEDVATSDDAGARQSAREYVCRIVRKLGDGWSGFVVDEYWAIQYTEYDLTAEIYDAVVQTCVDGRSVHREDLVSLYCELRPGHSDLLLSAWERIGAGIGAKSLCSGEKP